MYTMYLSTPRKYIHFEDRHAEILSNLLCVFADCTRQHCSDSSEAPNPTQSLLPTSERGGLEGLYLVKHGAEQSDGMIFDKENGL